MYIKVNPSPFRRSSAGDPQGSRGNQPQHHLPADQGAAQARAGAREAGRAGGGSGHAGRAASHPWRKGAARRLLETNDTNDTMAAQEENSRLTKRGLTPIYIYIYIYIYTYIHMCVCA